MAVPERIYEPTPMGGDYSEIAYFDNDMRSVEPAMATKCVIRECLADGTVVAETWGSCAPASAQA